MNPARRDFFPTLAGLTALAAWSPSSSVGADAPRLAPRPDPALFQAGDFVWPKKPGSFVPYNAGSKNSPERDRDNWRQERDTYLGTVGATLTPDAELRQRIQIFRDMDYREFLAVYEGNQEIGVPGAYSGGSVYVGHVGIVDIDGDGIPWVIEALIGKGVVKTRYVDWLTSRSDEVVWLGRVAQLDGSQRKKIADAASKEIDKPYRFWNFDLLDSSGFYCSKLAWYSAFSSLGLALDANPKSNRVLWYSPKQMLYSATIIRLFDPGPYASL